MNNTILFDKYENFAATTDKDIPHLIDLEEEELPTIFQGFKYPIGSWPVVINEKLTKELEEVCTELPQFLQQIPALYFKNNVKELAQFYFSGDQSLAHFFLLCHKKKVDVSCRLDLTFTENGFKVLEVNMGSSIGGMEFQNFEHLIRKKHPELLHPVKGRDFISKKTQTIYIQFLADKIIEYVDVQSGEINIYIVFGNEENANAATVVKGFFDELLSKELEKRNRKGAVYLDHMEALKFKNKQLYYEEKIMHSVLILDFALSDISKDVFRAFMSNQVYFPDHLGTMFLRDKRNLALLRELATQQKLEPAQNELILKYIPWTEIFENKSVMFKGETYDMVKLLRDSKDQFVIKIGDGLQGDDVHIGKFLSTSQWEEILEETIKNRRYIAQEFSDSIDLKAPNTQNQWVPHKLVWGAFGFGDTYGGVMVRMSSSENTVGAINGATGAVVAIVYECDSSPE